MQDNPDGRQAAETMPGQHCEIFAGEVVTSNRDGTVTDGSGTVKVYAREGRSLAIEITEDFSGLSITAIIDLWRPRRARVRLQSDQLIAAIQAAAREDGLPVPFPEPR